MQKPAFNPEDIYKQVISAGEDYADKKAAYESLNDLTKTILADMTLNYMDQSSRVEAETRALSSTKYRDHLAAKNNAQREYLKAEVGYKSLVMLAELRRTEESSRRHEMGIL